MPIYEYRCSTCGRVFEELAKSDQKTLPCPCGKGTAERVLSTFATVVKSSAAPCGASANACGIGGDMGRSSACGCCGGGPHRH